MLPFVTSYLKLSVLTSLIVVTSSCASNGSTEHLRAVLTGRCVQYKTFVNPTAVCGPQNEVNCTSVVDDFIDAFAGQEPCNVSMTRYDAFIAATRHEIPEDRSIFWEGVYITVHRYSQGGSRMVTLEDTLTGYMIDGLHFCSDPSEADGIGGPDTEFCPTYDQTENCTLNAEASFWTAASANFASKARGVITVMLNASAGEAYSDDTYFGTWELPNLQSEAVTHANIWLVQQPGNAIRERCDSENIQKLQMRFQERNITSSCTFNPQDVLWLLCWDHQDNPQCQDLVTSGGEASITVVTTLRLSFALVFLVPLFR